MEKQKLRSEIDSNYMWDLTTIYKTDDDWNNDFELVSTRINDIKKYEGILLKNAKTLLEYCKTSDSIDRAIYKLYYYAHLKHDQDTTVTYYQELVQKITNLLQEYSKLTSYVEPELLKGNYSTVEKYMNKLDELKKYRFNFESLYRYKKHILTKEQELMLTILSKGFNSDDTYEKLTDSDISFGNIKVDGKEVELTESNYSTYIISKDRLVRKQAFDRLLTTYSNYKNTISSTFKGNIDSLVSLAKVRNYVSSLEASLFEDNVDIKVYNNLIETVNNNLDKIYKYYDIKKKDLALDELHMYDIYCNTINLDKKYTFEEAKKIVINALSVLGENYIENLNKAFDEKWIDVYNNKGKRTGAYSSGFYDTNLFVLLNFEGKFNDVSTLAHELGHSMHTYYSINNNPYNISSYKIFVAEVASTVNELLLAKYMLKNSKDKEEKKYIIMQLLELFKATIFRQTMFAEFEQLMHSYVEKDLPLTCDTISNNYYDLVKKYFGDNVVCDDLIKYEWERIPHFYYNFYVYKYAIGLSSACTIVNNILNGDTESYINFLKSGGSNYPIEELKLAHVDATSPSIILNALNMFDELMEEYKTL